MYFFNLYITHLLPYKSKIFCISQKQSSDLKRGRLHELDYKSYSIYL